MLVNATSAVKETHMSAFEQKKSYEESVEEGIELLFDIRFKRTQCYQITNCVERLLIMNTSE